MQPAMTIPGAIIARLLSHILPRRSQIERRSAYAIRRDGGIDYITPMPGAVPMSKRRAQ